MDIREALETGNVESFYALLNSSDSVVENIPCSPRGSDHTHQLQVARVGQAVFQWLGKGPHVDFPEEVSVFVFNTEAEALQYMADTRAQVAQVLGMAQFAAAVIGTQPPGDFMVI